MSENLVCSTLENCYSAIVCLLMFSRYFLFKVILLQQFKAKLAAMSCSSSSVCH